MSPARAQVVGAQKQKIYIFEIVPSTRPCAQTIENRKKSTTDSTSKIDVFWRFFSKKFEKNRNFTFIAFFYFRFFSALGGRHSKRLQILIDIDVINRLSKGHGSRLSFWSEVFDALVSPVFCGKKEIRHVSVVKRPPQNFLCDGRWSEIFADLVSLCLRQHPVWVPDHQTA